NGCSAAADRLDRRGLGREACVPFDKWPGLPRFDRGAATVARAAEALCIVDARAAGCRDCRRAIAPAPQTGPTRSSTCSKGEVRARHLAAYRSASLHTANPPDTLLEGVCGPVAGSGYRGSFRRVPETRPHGKCCQSTL